MSQLCHGVDDAQILRLEGVRGAGKPVDSKWDLCCRDGTVESVTESQKRETARGSNFIVPSLCHPHIHLDKCYLLQHPKYADLEIQDGDFAEALKLTSLAKSRFAHDDLMARGRALIEESINFGVTHMRAFVEVDAEVELKCLEAGLALKEEFKHRCYVQICVFAQDPIVSQRDGGTQMKNLLHNAASRTGVEAFGTTPYVEENGAVGKQLMNMEFALHIARTFKLHLDFHIDYNLDPGKPSAVLDALDLLHGSAWPSDNESSDFRTIVFGHCTRLTLFEASEWEALRIKIGSLPVSFVGLPPSDLFMMGRPGTATGGGQRMRGTLQIPQMIAKYGLNGAIGINNIGNAFTPQGNCDPLSLASLGVGLYQAGTKADADILLACVSSRAKAAIGVGSAIHDIFSAGQPADFVIIENATYLESESFRERRTVQQVVFDAGHHRTTVFKGRVVSR